LAIKRPMPRRADGFSNSERQRRDATAITSSTAGCNATSGANASSTAHAKCASGKCCRAWVTAGI
jgi:hypothetical protein